MTAPVSDVDAQAFAVLGWEPDLDETIAFHNEIKRLLGRRLRELRMMLSETEGSSFQQTICYNIYLLEEHFKRIQNTTFLSFFSSAEQWLQLCWSRWLSHVNKNQKKTGIKRFSPIVNAAGLEHHAGWRCLLDASLVRDCLLHANGMVILSRDADELRRVSQSARGDIDILEGKLQIVSTYLERIHPDIRSFLRALADKAAQLQTCPHALP